MNYTLKTQAELVYGKLEATIDCFGVVIAIIGCNQMIDCGLKVS